MADMKFEIRSTKHEARNKFEILMFKVSKLTRKCHSETQPKNLNLLGNKEILHSASLRSE